LVALDRKFHRVVLANVLHLEPPEGAQAIIRRSVDWLRSDGELVIIGTIMTDTHESTRARSLYSIHLALRTANGTNHTAQEMERWCRQAGFSSFRLISADAPPGGLGALVATRS
jgi:hypothetical protein